MFRSDLDLADVDRPVRSVRCSETGQRLWADVFDEGNRGHDRVANCRYRHHTTQRCEINNVVSDEISVSIELILVLLTCVVATLLY